MDKVISPQLLLGIRWTESADLGVRMHSNAVKKAGSGTGSARCNTIKYQSAEGKNTKEYNLEALFILFKNYFIYLKFILLDYLFIYQIPGWV